MAKQKIRPTRLGVFSGAKAYSVYVEVLKKCRNAKGGLFATPSSLAKIRTLGKRLERKRRLVPEMMNQATPGKWGFGPVQGGKKKGPATLGRSQFNKFSAGLIRYSGSPVLLSRLSFPGQQMTG
jgi:hypothetical protein